MTPVEALKSLEAQSDLAVAVVASDLFSELIKVSPVDVGTLKGAWSLEKTKDGWRISNNMGYSSIIFDGRRKVGGQWYGSEQLPKGIDPILSKYNRVLENLLDRIKV